MSNTFADTDNKNIDLFDVISNTPVLKLLGSILSGLFCILLTTISGLFVFDMVKDTGFEVAFFTIALGAVGWLIFQMNGKLEALAADVKSIQDTQKQLLDHIINKR